MDCSSLGKRQRTQCSGGLERTSKHTAEDVMATDLTALPRAAVRCIEGTSDTLCASGDDGRAIVYDFK